MGLRFSPWLASSTVCFLVALSPSCGRAAQMASANFSVSSSAFAAAGGSYRSSLASVATTAGQPAPIGISASALRSNRPGLWPVFAAVGSVAASTPTSTAARTSTPAVTVTRTRSPTPSRTPTLPGSPLPTTSRTATLAATRTSSRTPTGGSTGTPSPVPGFHPRGDADCSVGIAAADVVATTRAFDGRSICGNDDCDRNGTLDAVDVDCTVSCLFDDCPVSQSAPRITAVLAESAPGLAPLSVVRIVGVGLGSEDRVRRVQFGGVEADVIDALSDTETLVLVPALPPGRTLVVAFDGDVGGAGFAVDLVAPVGVGAAETLGDTLDLLDAMLEQFVGLDLAELYGSTAPAVEAAVDDFRSTLVTQRAQLQDDPAYAAIAARLDQLVDQSGVAEMLRNAIEQIAGAASGGGQGAVGGTTVIARLVGQTTRVVGTLIVRAAPAAGVAPSVAAGGIAPIAAIGAAVAVVAAVLVANADAPVILKVIPDFPKPAGLVEIQGFGFGSLPPLPTLLVRTRGGTVAVSAEGTSGDLLVYRLPDAVGVCGAVELQLQRLLKHSTAVSVGVEPVLLELLNTSVIAGESLTLQARGVAPCHGEVQYEGFLKYPVPLLAAGGNYFRAAVPSRLAPGTYDVHLYADIYRGADGLPLRVGTAVEALRIECERSRLVLPPARPAQTECRAAVLPESATLPDLLSFHWSSVDAQVARVDDGVTSATIVTATRVGVTAIEVEAFYRGADGETHFFARSSDSFVIDVDAAATPTATQPPAPTGTPTPTVMPSPTTNVMRFTVNGRIEDGVRSQLELRTVTLAGASVGLFDTAGAQIGTALSDANGRFELDGAPAGDVIVRAAKAGFAESSVHARVSGVGFVAALRLFLANDECTSDLARFEIVRGDFAVISGLPTGEATLATALGQLVVHPDATKVCVGGDRQHPTIRWKRAWIPSCCDRPPEKVRGLRVQEEGRTPPDLFTLLFGPQTTLSELVPPLLYGQNPGGGVVVAGPAPPLGAGATYQVIVGGLDSTLVFRLR